MERLTEYLSSNFAVVIYVIAVPQQFYKDFNSEDWLSIQSLVVSTEPAVGGSG